MKKSTETTSIQDFLNDLDPQFLGSTPFYRSDLFPRPANQIKIFDFIYSENPKIEPVTVCETIYYKNKKKSDPFCRNQNEGVRISNFNKNVVRNVYSINFNKSITTGISLPIATLFIIITSSFLFLSS